MTEFNRRWSRRGFLKAGLAAATVAATSRQARAQMNQAQINQTRNVRTTGPDSLRAHARQRGLLFGAAVIPASLDIEGMASGYTADPYTQLVASQCDVLVAENAMKWGQLRPSPTTFDFTQADRMMRFAALAGQRVRGHNLCWHESLPKWFQSTAKRANARQLLTEHIQTVAGRYRGHIHSWDVVNEAVEPKDGRPDGLRISPWLELIGPEYIEIAFQAAASADPGAKLAYNEYDIELDTPEQTSKRAQVLMLMRRLKARNVPIHAFGIQSHLNANGPQPGASLQSFIRELKKLNIEVYLTELDVNTHSLEGGPEVQDYAVAQVYRNYLGLVLTEPNVTMALTWGITDAHTWLNESKEEWVVRKDGARQRPLPFDDSMQPTPAFVAIRTAIDAARSISKAPGQAEPATLYKPFRVPGSPAGAPPEKSLVPTPRVQ